MARTLTLKFHESIDKQSFNEISTVVENMITDEFLVEYDEKNKQYVADWYQYSIDHNLPVDCPENFLELCVDYDVDNPMEFYQYLLEREYDIPNMAEDEIEDLLPEWEDMFYGDSFEPWFPRKESDNADSSVVS